MILVQSQFKHLFYHIIIWTKRILCNLEATLQRSCDINGR